MPCYDPRPDMEREARQKALDERTAQLCEACGVLADLGGITRLSLELQDWWRVHAAWDFSRLKQGKGPKE